MTSNLFEIFLIEKIRYFFCQIITKKIQNCNFYFIFFFVPQSGIRLAWLKELLLAIYLHFQLSITWFFFWNTKLENLKRWHFDLFRHHRQKKMTKIELQSDEKKIYFWFRKIDFLFIKIANVDFFHKKIFLKLENSIKTTYRFR